MINSTYQFTEFTSRQSLAATLAGEIADQLQASIAAKGQAIIALSGGSTPKLMFQELCKQALDWAKVVITLVDERCVDTQHELSNERFLNENLLIHLPQKAIFVPLYDADQSADDLLKVKVLSNYCELTKTDIEAPARFDVVVLGMGDDGHTASFFPDADNIQQLVDLNESTPLMTCASPSSQVRRITWSLSMLLNTRMLALHITGESKKRMFLKALAGENKSELPIRTAIYQSVSPLSVYYSA